MKKKIFIGPMEVSGYYTNLAKGLRELDYDVSFFIRFRHKSGYPIENSNLLLKLHRIISDNRISLSKKHFIQKSLFVFFQIILERVLFIYFLFTHKVFIFTFMKTFFNNNVDLMILKIFNKKILMISNGSDVRPPYLSAALQNQSENNFKNFAQIILNKKSHLQKVEKYADIIVSGILRSQLLEQPFIERSFLGRPVVGFNNIIINHERLPFVESAQKNIKIVHAPSARNFKGTVEIIKAIEELASEGFKIHLEIIENKSNKEVLNAIEFCDIVIDQLYSDILMPGISAEAAVFGKPVIVGGYELEILKELLPQELIPPTYTCKPEEIKDAVKILIQNEDLRKSIGIKLNEFVKNQSHYKNIAQNYAKLIEDQIPDYWYIDPKKVEYMYGVGINKINLKKKLGRFINDSGVDSLQLSDKPLLLKKVLKFCEILSFYGIFYYVNYQFLM